MAVAHKNYFPPAGSIEVANDSSWTWDGHRWHKHGKVGTPSKGAPLRGKAGTAMTGWYYDWPKFAWIEPQTQRSLPPPVRHVPVHHAPMPAPAAAAPVVVVQPHKEDPMSDCKHHHPHHHQASMLDGLKHHPLVPLLGIGVLVASDFLTQPSPPQIP